MGWAVEIFIFLPFISLVIGQLYNYPDPLCTPPDGYEQYGANIFYKSTPDLDQFFYAKLKCENDGGTLPTAMDQNEWNSLSKFRGDKAADGDFWMDLLNPEYTICLDEACHGFLTWSNNTIFDFYAVNFTVVSFLDTELCSRLQFRFAQSEIQDTGCSKMDVRVVCQYKCPVTPIIGGSPGTCSTGVTPPNDFHQSPITGHFYWTDYSSKTMLDAIKTCAIHNASILTFRSEEEYTFMTEFRSFSAQNHWVALLNPNVVVCSTSEECNGQLKWQDGSVYTQPGNWSISHGLRAEKICSGVKGNLKVTQSNCDTNIGFLCQFDCDEPAVKTCPQIPDDFFPLLGGWYLNVDLELTYDEGEAFCNTYGANLLLARNVDEYEAARAISGLLNDEIYVGLKNPSGIDCFSAQDCNSLIFWDDGTPFQLDFLGSQFLTQNNNQPCFKIMQNGTVKEKDCSQFETIVCQFICPDPCPSPVGYSSATILDYSSYHSV